MNQEPIADQVNGKTSRPVFELYLISSWKMLRKNKAALNKIVKLLQKNALTKFQRRRHQKELGFLAMSITTSKYLEIYDRSFLSKWEKMIAEQNTSPGTQIVNFTPKSNRPEAHKRNLKGFSIIKGSSYEACFLGQMLGFEGTRLWRVTNAAYIFDRSIIIYEILSDSRTYIMDPTIKSVFDIERNYPSFSINWSTHMAYDRSKTKLFSLLKNNVLVNGDIWIQAEDVYLIQNMFVSKKHCTLFCSGKEDSPNTINDIQAIRSYNRRTKKFIKPGFKFEGVEFPDRCGIHVFDLDSFSVGFFLSFSHGIYCWAMTARRCSDLIRICSGGNISRKQLSDSFWMPLHVILYKSVFILNAANFSEIDLH
jgi:hypothetical protein